MGSHSWNHHKQTNSCSTTWSCSFLFNIRVCALAHTAVVISKDVNVTCARTLIHEYAISDNQNSFIYLNVINTELAFCTSSSLNFQMQAKVGIWLSTFWLCTKPMHWSCQQLQEDNQRWRPGSDSGSSLEKREAQFEFDPVWSLTGTQTMHMCCYKPPLFFTWASGALCWSR